MKLFLKWNVVLTAFNITVYSANRNILYMKEDIKVGTEIMLGNSFMLTKKEI